MTQSRPFTIQTIHARVARYLKRQGKRIQRQSWEALEHLYAGPFPADDPAHITHLKGPYHCSYRYALSRGRRGLRIKYDVDGARRARSPSMTWVHETTYTEHRPPRRAP